MTVDVAIIKKLACSFYSSFLINPLLEITTSQSFYKLALSTDFR